MNPKAALYSALDFVTHMINIHTNFKQIYLQYCCIVTKSSWEISMFSIALHKMCTK